MHLPPLAHTSTGQTTKTVDWNAEMQKKKKTMEKDVQRDQRMIYMTRLTVA